MSIGLVTFQVQNPGFPEEFYTIGNSLRQDTGFITMHRIIS